MKKGIFLTSLILFVLVLIAVFSTVIVAAASPNGANYTFINTSTAPADVARNNSAIAGNVTEVNIFGYSTTQAWQGYFGNVTGVIRLADGASNVMYNWTMASPTGEIFASTNNTITWSGITCFNFTEDTGEINASILESLFGIGSSDVDGVTETFNKNIHAAFSVGSVSFTANKCNNTQVFGAGGAATFNEPLLYEPGTKSVVFASLINNDADGFDGRTHDFEMLVLENGHSGDTATKTYYFYLELG